MFGINSRLHTVEERISKLEYRTKEITESGPKRKYGRLRDMGIDCEGLP